jgi:hypothetical protein
LFGIPANGADWISIYDWINSLRTQRDADSPDGGIGNNCRKYPLLQAFIKLSHEHV